MKYAVVTFGCRVNQADSLGFEEELRAAGGAAAALDEADLVVVNTCSVTATADQGARQTIRRIARENPRAKVVATGCYATRCADEVATLPGVIQVVRNSHKLNVSEYAGPTFRSGVRRVANADGPCGQSIRPGIAGRTAFTIRAQ